VPNSPSKKAIPMLSKLFGVGRMQQCNNIGHATRRWNVGWQGVKARRWWHGGSTTSKSEEVVEQARTTIVDE